MKIAITADWLITEGGAERVIKEMINLWPDAHLFTTVHNPSSCNLQPATMHTSRLQRPYRILKKHQPLLPWMPRAVESWDLRGFDTVISSSHAVAKGCIPVGGARHICYCHTPMRYAWDMEEEYLDDFGLMGPARFFVQHELRKIRQWDLTTAKRVDLFIANSTETQDRIKRIYERESIVLHPPVADHFFRVPFQKRGDYFLAVSRFVPYKRLDLLIEVANKEKINLKIAGSGPDEQRLKRMAGKSIEFVGRVSDEELCELYSRAKAFLFPVHEDAGIVPLEAQACGTPVIALGKGGAKDTVKEGETGVFFEKREVEDVVAAIKKFESMSFDRENIREHAKKFSSERFREKLERIVSE